MLKVRDIMTQNVITTSPNASVKDAAEVMYLNGLTGLPVLDEDDKLIGILTDTDLVATEKGIDLPAMFGVLGTVIYADNPVDGDEVEKQLEKITATKVEKLMNQEVQTISADAPVEELADLIIKKHVNPVPVTTPHPSGKGERVVGIVSKADIVKLIAGSPELRDKEWPELIKK